MPLSLTRGTEAFLFGRWPTITIVRVNNQADLARCLAIRHEGDRVIIQRLCMLKRERGKGYAKEAIGLIEGFYRAEGIGRMVLNAKFEVRGFYGRCGYQTVGEPFEQAGIAHVRMEKKLV